MERIGAIKKKMKTIGKPYKLGRKYFFLLHKRYFDTGFSILNYAKYPLVLIGFAIPDVKAIVLITILFAVICYFTGWWWMVNMAKTD